MSDDTLKAELASMLRRKIFMDRAGRLCWYGERGRVLDSELLYICELIEQSLTQGELYGYEMRILKRSTWQERAAALVAVKREFV